MAIDREINPLSNLYYDFLTILQKSTIKNRYEASKLETSEMTMKAEMYFLSLHRQDSFLTHMDYSYDMLEAVGIDKDIIYECLADRRRIPMEYRDMLLEMKRNEITSSYVEGNNYYRTLIGLPDIEDTDFIYIDSAMAMEFSIPLTKIVNGEVVKIPLHEYDETVISILENNGYLDSLKQLYPERKYLNHLGLNKIDLYFARTSKNHTLLDFPKREISITMCETFPIIYERSRFYYMSTLYVQEYNNIYDYYDNFIGLSIMLTTIQQIIVRSSKLLVDREFFDEQCIRYLFEMYNVPFVTPLAFETKVSIAQNLNLMIQNKATDSVFALISSVFALDDTDIFKYILVKEKRYDIDGLPIEPYKDIINENGETERVPDYQGWYNVYFKRIPVDQTDYYTLLQSKDNVVGYNDVVSEDPYWWDDEETLAEVYESEYNFRETKYLSLNIAYRLSEIVFESVYILNAIMDKKDNSTHQVMMELPKILGDNKTSIFSVIIFLCTLICESNNLKGEILDTPSKILPVLGFNFEEDLQYIEDYIMNEPLIDQSIVRYIQMINLKTIEGINSFVNNLKDLRDILSNAMARSSNIKEFRAYEKLYKALYIKEYNNEIFKINTPDGEVVAKTYEEYLAQLSPQLYKHLINLKVDDIPNTINHCIIQLNEMIPLLKTIYITDNSNNPAIYALNALIDFFKSYETQLLKPSVIYIFDTKALNMLKLIADVFRIEKTILAKQRMDLRYQDVIGLIRKTRVSSDSLGVGDDMSYLAKLKISTDLDIRDIVFKTISKLKTDELAALEDKLTRMDKLNLVKDNTLKLSVFVKAYSEINIEDTKVLVDKIMKFYSKLILEDKFDMSYHDNIRNITKHNDINDSVNLQDRITIRIIEK